jgi:hypothetical protein
VGFLLEKYENHEARLQGVEKGLGEDVPAQLEALPADMRAELAEALATSQDANIAERRLGVALVIAGSVCFAVAPHLG